MRSSATQLAEADLLQALRDVRDPELPANIVELGLVHSLQIAPDSDGPGSGIPGVPPRFHVTIDLLSRDPDPQADSQLDNQLLALIHNRLAGIASISRTQVNLLAEPTWTPDRIASDLRLRLSAAVASNQRSDALVQIQTAPATHRRSS